MVIKQERNTKKLLESARCRGQLVDLSDEARQAGLLCRCEVSVDLYRSLFWKYPSAGVQDTIAVGDLLGVLQSRLQCSRRPGKSLYAIQPPQPTWWMHSRYYLNLLVLYQGQRVESVVIMPRLATLESLSSSSPPSVPVSLLVRLIQSVRRLWPLCHLSERPLVRSIDVTVGELLHRSPFYAEIFNYLESQSSSVPCGYSRDEYREMMLRTLWEQLELTAAVAEKMGADINLSVSGVLQLMANYVGFVPASLDQTLPVEKVPYH